jgi:hypothetical protein
MTHKYRSRTMLLQVLAVTVLLAFVGCESKASKPEAKVEKPSLGPPVDPTRDEAASLIKACGPPNSDKQRVAEGGTERIMSWRRYGVDFYLLHGSDSPKWATTGIFLKGSEETIERETLSRKMPCANKTTLYSVDELPNWLAKQG